jgi:uncharacterized protein
MIEKIRGITTIIKLESDFKKKLWVAVPVILLICLGIILSFTYHDMFSWQGFKDGFNRDFLIFFLIGALAQLVDGSLGMGYGATCTSFLLFMGVPPLLSSTAIHVSEMFTTGASAISHFTFGNINKKLFKHLLIPGVIGSIIGAYLLSGVINGEKIKPFVAIYMMVLAVIIIIKAVRKNIVKKKTKHLGVLASFGGFMDAVGGGGWGPIVTSTLVGNGRCPKYTIGSVNAAEFAVSLASGVTFLLFGGIQSWQLILGLILGGVVTAPIAALLVHKIKRKPMMILVGIMILLLSVKTLSKLF